MESIGPLVIIWLIALWLFSAASTSEVASHKGYSTIWLWWGLLFGLVALLAIAALPPRSKD